MREIDPQIHAEWEQKLAKSGLPTEADIVDEEEENSPLENQHILIQETPEDKLKLASEKVLGDFSELPRKLQNNIIADVSNYQTMGQSFSKVSDRMKRLVAKGSSKQNFFSKRMEQIRSKGGELVSLEKRKQALAEIKTILIRQQRGLGLYIQDVYDQVYQNRKIGYEQLQKVVDGYSDKYGFSEDQLMQINSVLKNFWESHLEIEGVKERFERYPEGLFQLCFGKPPKTKVGVIYGPMTITFILGNEDYNFAHSGHEGQDSWDIAKLSGGVAFKNPQGALDVVVNIVRDTEPETSILHEDQHQFNKLFLPKENRQELSQAFLESVVEREATQKARRQKIAYALAKNVRKQTVDTKARDEILAQLRSKESTDAIYETIAKNPLYQYFTQDDIKSKLWSIREFFKDLKEGGDYDEEWVRGHQKIYLHIPRYKLTSKDWSRVRVPTQNEVEAQTKLVYQRYYDDLKEALNAVKALQKSGMDNSEIIPLLYTMPMDRWGVFARRFLNDQSPTAEKLEQTETVVQQPEIFKQNTETKPKKWYEKFFDYRSLWPKDSGGGGHGGHY